MPWPSNTPHLQKYKHIPWHIYTSVQTYTHATDYKLDHRPPQPSNTIFMSTLFLSNKLWSSGFLHHYGIMSLFLYFSCGCWCIHLNQIQSPWRWRQQVPPKWQNKLKLQSGTIQNNLTSAIYSTKTWQFIGLARSDITFRVYHWTAVPVLILMLYWMSVVEKGLLLHEFW